MTRPNPTRSTKTMRKRVGICRPDIAHLLAPNKRSVGTTRIFGRGAPDSPVAAAN
jgi:hypothetical protein